MIPNPTKTVCINESLGSIMHRLAYIRWWTDTKLGLLITNSNIDFTLNTYSFQCKAGICGIVDAGNYGNVSVSPLTDNCCNVTIEMGKNIGCISDQWEAQDCNNQISIFLQILSCLLSMSDEEVQNVYKNESVENTTSLTTSSTSTIIITILIVGALLIIPFIL